MMHPLYPFSIDKAHSWVASCLPEVPDRLTGAEAEFFFRATFVPSILKCSYRKGEAVFSSDSLKTLAILKDYVTREATASKLQVSPFSKTDAAHLFRDCVAEPALACMVLRRS